MSRVALTGGRGFLGWHTRCAAIAGGAQTSLIAVGDDFELKLAVDALDGSSRLVHLAAASHEERLHGPHASTAVAEQLAAALQRSANPPPVVVVANSLKRGDASGSGDATGDASEILERAAIAIGAEFIDARLPEVFGEHAAPDGDSVVATICRAVAAGTTPQIRVDREIALIHAQDAADVLLGHAADPATLQSVATEGYILASVEEIAGTYSTLDFPNLEGAFGRNLFNTYRSCAFERRQTAGFPVHRDSRGSLVELARSRGGAAQTAVSVTVPGATRAEHFHRRKVERVVPLVGRVTVGLRKMFSPDVMTIDLDAARPGAVDIPTLWTHNFHNPGPDHLVLMFWASPLHDPDDSDTYPEAV